MIVMVMRDDHGVAAREIGYLAWSGSQSLRAGVLRWAGSQGEDGIVDDPEAVLWLWSNARPL